MSVATEIWDRTMSDFASTYRVYRNVVAASDMDWNTALDLSLSEVRTVFAEEKRRRAELRRSRR